jgi:hypothetical protein
MYMNLGFLCKPPVNNQEVFKMKRIVQILLAIVMVISLSTFFASAEESDTVTLDLAALGGSQSYTPHGYAGVTGLMFGYGTVVDLGSYDLSQYGALKVTYATDMGYKAYQDGMTATAMFALKSNATTIGYANVGPNTEGLIASADCVDASEVNPEGVNWGKGERAAVIDLKDVDYNGEVYLSHFNSSGNEALVVKLELLPYKNVALGKAVSETLNGGIAIRSGYWAPEMLTDGVVQDTNNGNNLGWAFATLVANGLACNADAYVDLGAVYEIDSINVVNMKWSGDNTFPGAYELSVSTDGTTWTQVGACAVGEATPNGTDTYTFDPVEANYVRLHVSSHAGGWADANAYYSGFGELEVYGNYVNDSENGTPAYVPMEYVIARDQLLADEADVALVGGNSAVTICPALMDKAGAQVRVWGWVVSKRPIESYGYSIDGGDIVYDTAFLYPDADVANLAQNWGCGPYGGGIRYNIYVPFDTVCDEIRAFAKIDGQDVLVWTIKISNVYKNYTGTVAAGDAGGTSAWTGHTSGALKWQAAFNTDVSFTGINFPSAFAFPGTPLKVTLAQDGHFDDGIVYTGEIVRPGDGGFIVEFGQEIPAGQYVIKFKITDETLVTDGQYQCYAVYGYATDPLGDEYVLNSHGRAAFELLTKEEGIGFIPREVVIRVNVDGVNAGSNPIDKNDGSTTNLPVDATAMSFNGWVASNFPIEKYGYKIDGGETVYDESFKKVTEDADYTGIMDAAANLFGFAANGTGYRFLVQDAIPLTGGEHTVELVAYINGEEIHVRTYNLNIAEVEPTVKVIVGTEEFDLTPDAVSQVNLSMNEGGLAVETIATASDPWISIPLDNIDTSVYTSFTIKYKLVGESGFAGNNVYLRAKDFNPGYSGESGTWHGPDMNGKTERTFVIADEFPAMVGQKLTGVRFVACSAGGTFIIESITFNKDENADTSVEIESATAGGVGSVWLRPSDSESMKILFKTNQAFTQFNIPEYWASNPPQFGDLKANIEVSLYKFDTNLETTLAGTPVATAKYVENLGDNNVNNPFTAEGTGAKLTNYNAANKGFSLILDNAAEAGQYVVVITNDAGAGSYVVLPSTGDAAAITYGTDYIKYFYTSDTESFQEAVRFTLTLVDEGAFVELDPEQVPIQPGTVPVTEPTTEPNTQTGDAAVALFAVIAVLAMGAAVVFAKKRSF